MKMRRNFVHLRQRGFTLLELLLVLGILGLVTGAVFSQMGVAQQRMTTEGVKLDDFQEARDSSISSFEISTRLEIPIRG